jgi:hypothetical protein
MLVIGFPTLMAMAARLVVPVFLSVRYRRNGPWLFLRPDI